VQAGANLDAIQVFKLNVEDHPQSSNVYDSLGEAYLVDGDKALAIANYQRRSTWIPTTEMESKL